MVETITMLLLILTSAGAGGVVAVSIWEDRVALRRALAGAGGMVLPPLPPYTHRVAGPRPARFIRLQAPASIRAAA